MKRILIATDGSEPAREALEFGLDLAAEQDAWTVVAHVVPTIDVVPYSNFGFMAPALPHEIGDDDRKILREAAELAAAKGIKVRTELLRGDPAAQIVAYADLMDADLIVVGSRGHGAITSALIGSVSRAVLRESRRPVLIVQGTHVAAEVGVAA